LALTPLSNFRSIALHGCIFPGNQHIMNIQLGLTPLVSLLAGILILAVPRLLNFIVAIYLILIGLIGLFGAGNYSF